MESAASEAPLPDPDLLFNNGTACQKSRQFVNMEITDDLRCQSSDENSKRKPLELKTVSRRPISGGPAQSRCTGLQFLLEKPSEMRSYLVCKRKLFHPGPTVVIRSQSAAWLVWISAQETKDGAPQFNGISLQVIKEINAKLL